MPDKVAGLSKGKSKYKVLASGGQAVLYETDASPETATPPIVTKVYRYPDLSNTWQNDLTVALAFVGETPRYVLVPDEIESKSTVKMAKLVDYKPLHQITTATLSHEIRREIVFQILYGLKEMHDRGIPHLDHSTANIMIKIVGEQVEVKLIDAHASQKPMNDWDVLTMTRTIKDLLNVDGDEKGKAALADIQAFAERADRFAERTEAEAEEAKRSVAIDNLITLCTDKLGKPAAEPPTEACSLQEKMNILGIAKVDESLLPWVRKARDSEYSAKVAGRRPRKAISVGGGRTPPCQPGRPPKIITPALPADRKKWTNVPKQSGIPGRRV
jgi:tRNA A-37 threonylcarbamoyl transferase component Bud32